MATERFVLPGSERAPHPGAQPAGAPDPSQFIEVSIVLRRKAPLELSAQAQPIDRAEFAARYGADPRDVDRVDAFAQQYDLHIVAVDLARRTVVVGGTVAAMNEAFGTSLALYHSEHGTFRGRTGPLYLPVDLQQAVVAVLGLDDRPQARVRCRRHRPIAPSAAAAASYTPPQVAALYQFPTNATGAGQTIAIVELGGGYKSADLTTYFAGLGVTKPSVTAVSVDGGKNAPTGDPNGADGEVLLDVEIAGSIAHGAKIAVYFAPNTDQGFLDAITTAIHDTTRRPTIVSISWGGPESTWTSQAMTSYDDAFQDAAALGVTVCCASGDSGSSDGVSDGRAHVDFPASSPHALACGGTRVAGAHGTLSSEVVWNDGVSGGATGGGVSDVFALPAFQHNAHVPVSVNSSHFKGRGVPDVAGDADPASGYQVRVDGHDVVYGGTSAVAPLWSALIALVNERRGSPVGYVTPTLYSLGAQACRDITSGTNGAYSAAAGWDACTGLGSPNGAALATLLGKPPTKAVDSH
ncbi:MAG TPA: S53 family peptidase [Vicinamibacterales bacterium]|nr:S53 family peptidase [Vicinamibacterales bacterium]